MYMLGYEVDFGHMEAVNLISSAKYSEKSVGYAWCALMLREGDELLRLIINSIRSDLISRQDNAICLALNSICNVGGKEFAEALATDVLALLTANTTRTYVRKKAALTTLRLYRKLPDMLPASEWADKILMLLDEKNIGVLTSVSSLVLGILAVDTQGWESCAAKAARTLTRLVLNKDYSNDYLYYGIPTPWLQIKLLRMLQFFPPPEEHALKMRVSEVLQRIVTGTDVTKNVNKNNVTHAVLFEAINLVIHLGRTTELLPQACGLLGRFISIREANIRYLGLETMARLSIAQPDTMEALKKHQSTILFSLKDQDISIRRRALDLVYSMCDRSTVKETVAELLSYLETADMHLKEELVLKIAILAERFRAQHEWYVDVVLALVKAAGDYVSEEIWYRVVQIITNQGDDLQRYAAQEVWRALVSDRQPHRTLLKIAGYVLGEFGHTIAENEGSRAEDQLRALHEHFLLVCGRNARAALWLARSLPLSLARSLPPSLSPSLSPPLPLSASRSISFAQRPNTRRSSPPPFPARLSRTPRRCSSTRTRSSLMRTARSRRRWATCCARPLPRWTKRSSSAPSSTWRWAAPIWSASRARCWR